MERLEKILEQRKMQGKTWDQLASNLPIKGNALRTAFTRKSVSDVYLKEIEQVLGLSETVNELAEPEVLYNTNGNSFVELPDGSYLITVPLIPVSAHASYVESLEEATVLKDFEKITFRVDHFGKGNYMGFVINGDSMNGGNIDDVKNGAAVLARELGRQHWRDGFNKTDHGWIIIHKDAAFHKDITSLDKETGEIVCASRNDSPEYPDFSISLNDVHQILKVIKRQQ